MFYSKYLDAHMLANLKRCLYMAVCWLRLRHLGQMLQDKFNQGQAHGTFSKSYQLRARPAGGLHGDVQMIKRKTCVLHTRDLQALTMVFWKPCCEQLMSALLHWFMEHKLFRYRSGILTSQ
jgi:hypothetical protein